jgi:hypothetical protein
MNNMFGQAKNFFKTVVTSVAGTKAATINAATEKQTETPSLQNDKNEKKAGNSIVEEGKSNKNTIILNAAMEKQTETPSLENDNNEKKVGTSTVEEGKSNKKQSSSIHLQTEEEAKKPSAKKTVGTTNELISIKGSSDEEDFKVASKKRRVGEVGNRPVRSTKILLRTGKRPGKQKEMTEEELQSKVCEEVIGGGFKSNKANEQEVDRKKNIPKKKGRPQPNSGWDNWWRVTIVTLQFPTHDFDGNEIPGVEYPPSNFERRPAPLNSSS